MENQIQKYGLKLLEVLLVPLVLLLLGVWLQHILTEGQEDVVVTQMVDSYFGGVASHLSDSSSGVGYTVAIARTRALFARLRQLNRKDEIVNVLRFISEAEPSMLEGDVFEQDPQSDKFFVDLSGVDLTDISIDIIEVAGLRIWGANFDGATFYNFECEGCGFSNSTFRDAEFNNVSFVDSDLTAVDFRGSNIEQVSLEGAILDRAKWSDGRICAENSIAECK